MAMEMPTMIIHLLLATALLGHSSVTNGDSLPSETQLITTSSTAQHSVSHNNNIKLCSQNKEWFCFNSTTEAYNCSQIQSILPDQFKCLDSGPALSFGYCATFNKDTRVLSILPACGYFQYGAYNVTTPGYIQLPTLLTELNDYMCSPLHRKGLACSECADGFGPSLTSYWHRCANCTDAWYGVPLVLAIEFIPTTVFYLIVVLFHIRLTAPPMPCLIMFAQTFHIGFEALHPVGQAVSVFETKDGHIRWFDMKIARLLYAMFNLDFFLSILPPFCISSKLKFYHVMLLGYISAFYPIFLIFLTWLFIELHGRNYRLLHWLWKPFQLCLARLKKQGIDTKSDLVDVFATFFLLSYHKCLYQTQMYCGTALSLLINVDPSGTHFSIDKGTIDGSFTVTYIAILVTTLVISGFFCLLPPILLTCYPFRLFRSSLSKCHLDTIAVNTFAENFHGYYRNGLDGGRDMRSLSGFYFFLVLGIFIVPLLSACIISLRDYALYYPGVIILLVALMISFSKPYKRTYANVFDTLILTDLAFIFLYNSYNNGSSIYTWSILPRILELAPIAIFTAALLLGMVYKTFRVLNMKSSRCYKFLRGCRSEGDSRRHEDELSESTALMIATATAERPLISTAASYGTLHNN